MEGTLFIGRESVEKYLLITELVEGIEKAFVDYSQHSEGLVQPQRSILNVTDDDIFLVKPAIYTPEKVLGAKLLTLYPDNESVNGLPSHQAIVTIFNTENGSLEAVMDGISITDFRTAAATAAAFKHLTKQNSAKVLTIIGTGHQAESHIKVLCKIASFREIRVCGKTDSERARNLASKYSAIAFSTIEEAVKDADVIVTVTKSTSKPFLQGKWVKQDAFVSIVGAPLPTQRDVDDDLMKSSFVVADTVSGSYASSGDVIQSNIQLAGEIGDIISGKLNVDWNSRRVFKSNGMAVQDLIAGKIVIKNMKKAQQEKNDL